MSGRQAGGGPEEPEGWRRWAGKIKGLGTRGGARELALTNKRDHVTGEASVVSVMEETASGLW